MWPSFQSIRPTHKHRLCFHVPPPPNNLKKKLKQTIPFIKASRASKDWTLKASHRPLKWKHFVINGAGGGARFGTFHFSRILAHRILKLSRADRVDRTAVWTAEAAEGKRSHNHRRFREAWVLAILPPFTSLQSRRKLGSRVPGPLEEIRPDSAFLGG